MFNYFSKDPNKRAIYIFNLIAPLYAKLDFIIGRSFEKSLKKITSEINLKNKKVLDIGTGTGAWGAMFLKYGAKEVHGIDFSGKMIKKAKSKHNNIIFSIGDAENLKEFADNSFDIVTASYVFHGIPKQNRLRILKEIKRVSNEFLIINDFAGRTPIILRILETLEQSDYKSFKKDFMIELDEIFTSSRKYELEKGYGLYIANMN